MVKKPVFPLSRSALVGALIALIVVSMVGAACSSSSKADTKTSSSSSTTSTTVKFSGAGGTEFCTAYKAFASTYTSDSLNPATVPVDQLAAKWAAAIEALKGMEAVATPEIKGDVTLLRQRVEGLQPALAAAGYDPTKVPVADRKKLQDAAAAKASDRLSSYGAQVCKA